MLVCAGPSDPFDLQDSYYPICHKNPAGLATRSRTIDPTKKTLVLITTGQSIWVNVVPSTTNHPTNAAAVDNFNIYDGNLYEVNGSLLGCTASSQTKAPNGWGNIACGVADKLVTAGKFDRVIIAPIAIGGSISYQWGLPTGDPLNRGPILYNRTPILLQRLAAAGITPQTPGVTFAHIWGCGESDNVNNTDPNEYATNVRGLVANMEKYGFAGRTFVPRESHYQGATNVNVQTGQALLLDGSKFFFGGDFDSLGNSYRFDTTHPNATGLPYFEDLMVAAMAASGTPF